MLALAQLGVANTLYQFFSGGQAGAATGTNAQALGQICDVFAAGANRFGDLAVGDSVANTYVHRECNTKRESLSIARAIASHFVSRS